MLGKNIREKKCKSVQIQGPGYHTNEFMVVEYKYRSDEVGVELLAYDKEINSYRVIGNFSLTEYDESSFSLFIDFLKKAQDDFE